VRLKAADMREPRLLDHLVGAQQVPDTKERKALLKRSEPFPH
jgi:hypothetical protein